MSNSYDMTIHHNLEMAEAMLWRSDMEPIRKPAKSPFMGTGL